MRDETDHGRDAPVDRKQPEFQDLEYGEVDQRGRVEEDEDGQEQGPHKLLLDAALVAVHAIPQRVPLFAPEIT